ncbi:MAG: 23S rRNA (pseudouridine(1915)-N(3))-methyltransferase RlmH [Gemmatimonadota bacterium]
MEITLLAVGKLRPFYRDAVDEYLRRIQRYAKIVEREIRESSRTGSISEINLDESAQLLEKIPARATVIGLTRLGAGWSSPELAERVDRWLLEARPLVFAIGGSTGLDEMFIARSHFTWSLGPLTLPHELARVVVCEQLYRAFTILRGEPYHKGR